MDRTCIGTGREIKMSLDKSKQLYSWWNSIDVDLNCYCGSEIHFSYVNDEDISQKKCSNCGQLWILHLAIIPVQED